jgi:hypothetical protein
MMTTLYALSSQYHELQRMSEDEEIPPEHLAWTIADITASIEAKCKSISTIILNLRSDSIALKQEEERMAKRRKALGNKVEWLSQYLMLHMLADGIEEIKSTTFTVRVRENPPSVIIDSESLIPEKFISSVISQKVHKDEILKDLKAGIQVPGAHLGIGKRLEIK